MRNEQASEEIQKFLRALDSYPERVAKEPSVSFRRHLIQPLRRRPAKNPMSPGVTNSVRDFYRLAGGTIPFMRRYSTICP